MMSNQQLAYICLGKVNISAGQIQCWNNLLTEVGIFICDKITKITSHSFLNLNEFGTSTGIQLLIFEIIFREREMFKVTEPDEMLHSQLLEWSAQASP